MFPLSSRLGLESLGFVWVAVGGLNWNGNEKSGQQTPRRWGWGTPLKKRAATRMRQCYILESFCQLARNPGVIPILNAWYIVVVVINCAISLKQETGNFASLIYR
jgi:hypothetical protein